MKSKQDSQASNSKEESASEDNKNTLDIITEQIKILRARAKIEFCYADTKKLSELVKIRNLIMEKPTEINEIIEDSQYSEFEVLSTLRRMKTGVDTRSRKSKEYAKRKKAANQ